MGNVLSSEGDHDKGLEMIERALAGDRGRPGMLRSIGLCFRSRALRGLGRLPEAMISADETIAAAHLDNEVWWLVEMHRLRALLRLDLDAGARPTAMAELRQAIDIGEEQPSRIFQLRAATDLARMTAEEGARLESRVLLRRLHDRITEAPDHSDMLAAKALIDELA